MPRFEIPGSGAQFQFTKNSHYKLIYYNFCPVLCIGVVLTAIFLPSQRDGIAEKLARLPRGSQGQKSAVLKIVVDAARNQGATAKVVKIVIVNPLGVAAVALPPTVQVSQLFLLLGVDTQHRDGAGMGLASQGVDRAELLVALVWVDLAGDELFAQRTATITSPLQ